MARRSGRKTSNCAARPASRIRCPSIARALGLVQEAGLTTALIGQVDVHRLLQSAGSFSVLTSGSLPPNPTELLGSAQLKALLRDLAERFDHVVVDTAPVLPTADTAVIAPAMDGCLLVVRASHTSCYQLGETLRSLRHVGAFAFGTVLNMTKPKDDGLHGYMYDNRPRSVGARRFHRLRRLVHGGQARAIPRSRHRKANNDQLCSATTERSAKK